MKDANVTEGTGQRHALAGHLRWLKIGQLQAHPRVQRKFKQPWALEIAATFDLEKLGFLTVSRHGESWWVVDGQHRLAALKIFGFSDDDLIQCYVYDGLTEKEEADRFLGLNRRRAVDAISEFRMGVVAGYREECDIDEAVRQQGLRIGRPDRDSFTMARPISAVGSLRKAYRACGLDGLRMMLRVIRDAYGEAGFEAQIIDGISAAVQRYGDLLEEDRLVKGLTLAPGGLGGLLAASAKLHVQTGQPRAQCIAAAAVGFYNRQPGAKKLAPWWKEAA